MKQRNSEHSQVPGSNVLVGEKQKFFIWIKILTIDNTPMEMALSSYGKWMATVKLNLWMCKKWRQFAREYEVS
jgi:hypothetical protein